MTTIENPTTNGNTYTTDVAELNELTLVQRNRINTLLAELTVAKENLAAAETRLENAQNDAYVICEYMNEYADNVDWCSEYDDRVDTLQHRMKVLQLHNRRKQWKVRTKVTLTYYIDVEDVEATSEEGAISSVDCMDISDVVDMIGGIREYEDYEIDARSATEE